MTNPTPETQEPQVTSPEEPKPTDSYVKLAMRNMVRKGGKSLRHFFLTMIGLMGLLIGLSYLTKP
ncbi:MAG: DUF3285 domain-containing protein [Xenococcaceae cyanobacterium MO_207.B15]|nr:DUF3285 domain-containing protein [Xenococcaceae cyanobacterium MO_207.B15]MDJ0743672.1 DUF3285 domain-containing protein [Xenococcaceae cyanobacterium MO_167.B27]